MSKIKNLALIFALSIAAIGFYLYVAHDSNSPSTTSSVEVYQPQQQTKSELPVEVQPAPAFAGQDPFKRFLDEKPNNPSSSVKPENAKDIPIQAGKDPFKEFLDKQKQNSKDQVVSPFGKN